MTIIAEKSIIQIGFCYKDKVNKIKRIYNENMGFLLCYSGTTHFQSVFAWGEKYHEKEKVTVVYLVYKSIDFSYIQSSFGYDWGGANIDQEITSVQENQDNNSNQNEKDQESDSKDISDSKDQKDEPSSGTDKEEDSDS